MDARGVYCVAAYRGIDRIGSQPGTVREERLATVDHEILLLDLHAVSFVQVQGLGYYMTAALRCEECGIISQMSGVMCKDRESAGRNCMAGITHSHWRPAAVRGVVCPGCALRLGLLSG